MEPTPASMRLPDGTRLDASVWRPAGGGRHPVLLMRQPYGRAIASTVVYAHPAWYAAQGYLVVVQDVRGAGTSEGAFEAYGNDAADGAAAVEWAAGLPGSDGRVGMYGFSYQGATQLLAASRAPAALRAIAPAMAVWDVHAEKAAEGGAFALAGSAGWAAQMGALQARRVGDAATYAALAAFSETPRFDGVVPAAPDALTRTVALHHYDDWRLRAADDPYWARVSPSRQVVPERFDVPALHLGGWLDYNLSGTWGAWGALSGRAAAPQALIIGPWQHLNWGAWQAGHDFGAAAEADRWNLAWFDWALKGRGTQPFRGARLFDMGTRRWTAFDAAPEVTTRRYHLTGDGLAAARGGGLSAVPGPPGAEWWVHDPWRPAPSTEPLAERTEVDARTDIAVFTSAPLDAPLTLLGVPEAVLAMAADAPSHDVAATLSVVRADGRVVALGGGIRSAPPPGAARVAMRPTHVTIHRGERLRLSVAGAAFPAHPVNPGTGTDPRVATAAEAVPITLTLDRAASVLELPVLELPVLP